MKAKIVLVSNSSWNIINYRLGLVKSFLKKGFAVTVIAPSDNYSPLLDNIGCNFIPISINSRGKNPIDDLIYFIRILFIIKREKPNFLLCFTIKPNIFATLAASFYNIKIINNISGLGISFINMNLFSYFILFLYRIALRKSYKVFFQNKDDRNLFLRHKIVNKKNSSILAGSGINLKKFCFNKIPTNNNFTFTFISRLLKSKGIKNFLKSAHNIKNMGFKNIKFNVIGFHNPSCDTYIESSILCKYINNGLINYHGHIDDVRPYLRKSSCIVLPSYYREGVPRVLIEALSIGRPIITTNSVGCKETVNNNKNGFLCNPNDQKDLQNKMIKMLCLPSHKLQRMCINSRIKAEIEFDEKLIIYKYNKLIF